MPLPSALGVALLTAVVAAAAGASATKPNIVMLVVDDWGHYDWSHHRPAGDREISTPNLDALVQEGLELTNAYSYYWCTPSRSSLISGRLPHHVMQDKAVTAFQWDPDHADYAGTGVPRNMTTMPAFMKRAGYKWDAGLATPTHYPVGRGFDQALVYANHCNSYWTYNQTDPYIWLFKECDGAKYGTPGFVDMWDGDGPMKDPPFGEFEDMLFNRRVMDILDAHAADNAEAKRADPDIVEAPLFLYYAPHVAHAPLEAPTEYMEKFDFIDNPYRQTYHAMINVVDDAVGNLTAKLKSLNMWNNTLIVVQADNGGPIYSCSPANILARPTLCGGANNHPKRGGKLSPWQGGINVNAFVSGGYLPESRRGAKESGMLHLADYLQTFCDLAGIAPCTDPAAQAAGLPGIDSLSMWPLIAGTNTTSPRTHYPMTENHTMALVRADGMKLLRGNDITFSLWTGTQFPNNTTPNGHSGFNGIVEGVMNCEAPGCLFNITADPNEHVNLADDSTYASILKELNTELDAAVADTFAPGRGSPMPDGCTAAINRWGGFWGPWADLD